jgi:hypothetical protein
MKETKATLGGGGGGGVILEFFWGKISPVFLSSWRLRNGGNIHDCSVYLPSHLHHQKSVSMGPVFSLCIIYGLKHYK